MTLVSSLKTTPAIISTDTHDSTDGRIDLSQEFQTGTDTYGYGLNSVTLWARRSGTIDESTITVTIRVATGDVLRARPDLVVATLTKSTGALGTTYAKHTWEAPDGTVLAPGLTYYLFIEHSEASATKQVGFSAAGSTTGTYGWTLAQRVRSYPQTGSPGTESPVAMEVKGVVVTAPDPVRDLASAQGCDGLELSWSAVTGATRYRIEWKRPSGHWPAQPLPSQRRIVSGTTTTLDALQTRGEHKLRVRAGNEYAFSGGSNVLTVTDVGCVTARWADAPEMHMGVGSPFTVTLSTNVPVVGTRRDMRREIVSVTGAKIAIARRTDKVRVWSELGGNGRVVTAARAWELTVEPSGSDDIVLEVQGDLACDDEAALCGHLGQKLSKTVSITIPSEANLRTVDPDAHCPKGGWPLTVCVLDATVAEGGQLAFKVVLNRKVKRSATQFVPELVRRFEVWFDVEISGGTATRREPGAATGGDYRWFGKTRLYIGKGRDERIIRVQTHDDTVSDPDETVEITISNAQWINFWVNGAGHTSDGIPLDPRGKPTARRLEITRAEATGTITNSDPIPRAWLARFARAAAEPVVDAVRDRVAAPRAPGVTGTLAGYALHPGEDGTPPETFAHAFGTDPGATPRTLEVRSADLLGRSSFTLTSDDAGGGSYALWGRGTLSGFDGADEGVSVDGDVHTLTLGADWAGGPWLAGVALSHSSGEGAWRGAEDAGDVEASLTGLYPYAAYDLSERLTLWGAGGRGTGELMLDTGYERLRTDISMTMGAAGARGGSSRATATRVPRSRSRRTRCTRVPTPTPSGGSAHRRRT